MVSRPVIGSTTAPATTLGLSISKRNCGGGEGGCGGGASGCGIRTVRTSSQTLSRPLRTVSLMRCTPAGTPPRSLAKRKPEYRAIGIWRVPVAHVVARQTQFGIAHRLAIEMDGDGRYAGDAGRPARDIKMAFDAKVRLIAGKVDLASSILYALGHRQRGRNWVRRQRWQA